MSKPTPTMAGVSLAPLIRMRDYLASVRTLTERPGREPRFRINWPADD